MGYDSYSSKTIEQKLVFPLNGVMYTTSRGIPSEKPLPEIGSSMQYELGAAWADSDVTSVSKSPNGNQHEIAITHVRVPAVEVQGASNYSFTQGSELLRTYIVKRSLYFGRNAAQAAAASPTVAGEFIVPIAATPDSKFSEYGFADDTLMEAPEGMNGSYVVIQRRFLRVVTVEISYDTARELRMKRTFTIVPANYDLDADTAGVSYELEPVNIFHSRRVKLEAVPKTSGWTLASYLRKRAVRTGIPNLPRELLSVNVIWNSSFSVGTQDYLFSDWQSGSSYKLAKSADDSASSAASISPEIELRFRDIESSNLPADEYDLMILGDATEADVIARLNAILSPTTVVLWPIFRPESFTISTTGQSISVRSNVGISLSAKVDDGELTSQGMDRAVSDDFSVSLSVGAVQVPACLHGVISITGGTSMDQPVAATATMAMTNSLVGTNSATKTKSGIAKGRVSPTTIPAVSGVVSIPTAGLYVLDIRSGGMFLGYTFVTVTVLNAASLA
jgi:hypothetical protein